MVFDGGSTVCSMLLLYGWVWAVLRWLAVADIISPRLVDVALMPGDVSRVAYVNWSVARRWLEVDGCIFAQSSPSSPY